jgi:hypothetical protein
VDEELIDEVLALYRRYREADTNLDEDSIAEMIIWNLRECEILDLATEGLPDHTASIPTTRILAMRRIHSLMESFKKYRLDD